MAGKFLTNWGDDENKALTEWIARAAALGIDITTVRPILRGGARESVRALSDSVAVREALRRAAACRCGQGHPVVLPRPPGDRSPANCIQCGRAVEEGRLCYAYPICYTCLPPPPPIPVVGAHDDAAPEPATNPLLALRTSAKLTQVEAADALGIARRTWQIAEASAAPSAALVAKARKALGKAGAK
jgi:hypothetical protein